MPFVVTIAVRTPAVAGSVEKATVIDVEVAAVTAPTAPLLNVTVLFTIVVSNPMPLIVSVFVSAVIGFEISTETTGMMFATCTGAPLEYEFVMTVAVSEPASVALVVKVTVSDVADAAVTMPSAPLLSATTLLVDVDSRW